jgi:hypothetical protein
VIAAEIRRLLLAGHELADLIILELGGLSNLDRFGDRIGEHRLRRFTGHYSDDGEQLLTRAISTSRRSGASRDNSGRT